ncbi:hypothetical protein K440DRAFT_633090 [Wilcoxina mikolae CBS 423.85]|nr:hypothetical protein K440DRAFT_633090 [Wilcoxina mikolae CBS 423.85]
MKFHLIALAAHLISLASAATAIRGSIPPSNLLINPSELPADTIITLTTSGIKRSTLLRADNSFVFRNVSEGSYILDTSCSTHHFAPLRVDVTRDGGVSVVQTFRGNAWSNSGEKRGTPIELRPVKVAEYYVAREGFNLIKMLSSPMILIAIVSLVSIVFLPKMLDKMDPEFKAEFAAQQRKSGGAAAANPITNFDAASFLAGMGKSDPAPATQQQQGQGKRK